MSAPADGLPPLREVIARLGLRAKKNLGQNFLLDLNLTRKIARAAAPLAGHAVIEVGPGPGGLTRALLLEGAERVIAVERDARVLPALEEIAERWPGRLEIVHADALALDFPALAAEHAPGLPVKIVANLPYNIATALLTTWLTATRHPSSPCQGEGRGGGGTSGAESRAWPHRVEEKSPARPPAQNHRVVGRGRGAVGGRASAQEEDWPPFWRSLTLMFQKEVAERITARPKTKPYGRLAVLAQWRAEPRILFEVPAAAFTPPPKVTSALVRITPGERPPCPRAVASLERVTKAAFGQRRKMLRQSLKSLLKEPPELLREADIAPTRRAEELSVQDFVRLACTYEKLEETSAGD